MNTTYTDTGRHPAGDQTRGAAAWDPGSRRVTFDQAIRTGDGELAARCDACGATVFAGYGGGTGRLNQAKAAHRATGCLRRIPPRQRVIVWSLNIHGRGSDRHAWAIAAADALLAGEQPPPFPSPFPGTRAARVETVRRILDMPPPADPDPTDPDHPGGGSR